MKGLENSAYMIGLLVSNIVALLMLWAAIKNQRIARILFFLLFTWASITNWSIASTNPKAYLEYAELTFLPIYRSIILGPFSEHISLYVSIIATCQALIAISMLLKGTVLKIGAIGAITFLIAIIPFGVGSGFPCTLIMAVAMIYVLRHSDMNYLWLSHHTHKVAWQ